MLLMDGENGRRTNSVTPSLWVQLAPLPPFWGVNCTLLIKSRSQKFKKSNTLWWLIWERRVVNKKDRKIHFGGVEAQILSLDYLRFCVNVPIVSMVPLPQSMCQSASFTKIGKIGSKIGEFPHFPSYFPPILAMLCQVCRYLYIHRIKKVYLSFFCKKIKKCTCTEDTFIT